MKLQQIGLFIAVTASLIGGMTAYAPAYAEDAQAPATSTTAVGTNASSAQGDQAPAQAAGSSGVLAEAAAEESGENNAGTIAVNYFGIFYGPSVQDPSSFQPDSNGNPDPTRPLLYKNFLGLGYRLTDAIAITPTAYWQWVPVRGGQYAIQDPYVKISHNSLISSGGFNLYGDVRFHVPVSDYSRAADSLGGIQTVEVATYTPQGSRFTLGFFGSARYNFYGSDGYGNDTEIYAGPNVSYQMTPSLAGVVLYEYNLNHTYGDPNNSLRQDGYDIQPGLNWDVTNSILFNPYVNVYPTSATLKSTSLGFLISWQAM